MACPSTSEDPWTCFPTVSTTDIDLSVFLYAASSSGMPAQALAAGFGVQQSGRANSGPLNRAPQSLPSAGLTSLQQKVGSIV